MKSLFKNSLFYVCLILFLGAGFLAVDFVKATTFSEPTGSYPEGTPELPIDTSDILQTKEGDLTVDILSIVTSTPEKSPVRLTDSGIYMRETLDPDSSHTERLYWDDISSWSRVGDDVYYDKGGVSIGTSVLPDAGVGLNLEGRLDMNYHNIINVSPPAVDSDVVRKGDVDSGTRRVVSDKVYAERWDDGLTSVYVSDEIGGAWDFCFLTEFERDSENNYKEIEESECNVVEDAGGWKLEVRSDDRAWTKCAARCIKFE